MSAPLISIKYYVASIKGVITLFSLFFCLLLTTYYLLPTVHAQESTQSATASATSSAFQTTNYQLPTYIPPTSPVYTDLLVHNMFHTFSCLASGFSITGQPCLTYKLQKDAQGAIQSVPILGQANLSGGALGAVTSLLGIMFTNPPIRTANYLASVEDSLGIVKEVHAQVGGSGAKVLDPVLKLWQVSRNMAYLVMIIIFVVIGLMIMFRQRINPQTVITAQAALPGLVIGLILITFSYFSAALITDLAFVGTNVVGSYFSAAQTPSPNSNLVDTLKDKNVLSIMSTFVGATGQGDLQNAVGEIISELGRGPELIIKTFASFLAYQYSYQFAEVPATAISGAICGIAGGLGALNPLAQLTGTTATTVALLPNCIAHATIVGKTVVGAAAATAAFAAPAFVISWALYVILIAILIYTMFKLLFRLVNNFLAIIFYTVTAPFYFLVASLPGRQGIATGWILNMLCNVLVFPAVIGVFYFVNFLLGSQASGVLT